MKRWTKWFAKIGKAVKDPGNPFAPKAMSVGGGGVRPVSGDRLPCQVEPRRAAVEDGAVGRGARRGRLPDHAGPAPDRSGTPAHALN